MSDSPWGFTPLPPGHSADAAAFAAHRAIESGEWDRHLDALARTIAIRQNTLARMLREPHPCRGCGRMPADHPVFGRGDGVVCGGWY